MSNNLSNKDRYLKETIDSRQGKKQSHFGNNLRLFQTIYENGQDIESQSQEEWAELMGLSRTNFRFWSRNRNTVPHYKTVKKVVDFFNKELNLPEELLDVAKMINIDYSYHVLQSLKTNREDFEATWNMLPFTQKEEYFYNAITNANKQDAKDLKIDNHFKQGYSIKLEKGKLSSVIYDDNNLIDIILSSDPEIAESSRSRYLVINPQDMNVIQIKSESSINVYKASKLPDQDYTMIAMYEFHTDPNIYKNSGLIRIIETDDKMYVALVTIIVKRLKEHDTALAFYKIQNRNIFEIDDYNQFYIQLNKEVHNKVRNLQMKSKLLNL